MITPADVNLKYWNGWRAYLARFSNITHMEDGKFVMYCTWNEGVGEKNWTSGAVIKAVNRTITVSEHYPTPEMLGDQKMYRFISVDGVEWTNEGDGLFYDKNGVAMLRTVGTYNYSPLPAMVLPRIMNATERP